jgi:hypothetical protein
MNRMQAPWRIDYIRSAKEEGCILVVLWKRATTGAV